MLFCSPLPALIFATYLHHTRQNWWLTKTMPPNFPQKHHIRNAIYVAEYLYGFVLLLLLCTLHCTCSFCCDQLLQKFLWTSPCFEIRQSIPSSSVSLWKPVCYLVAFKTCVTFQTLATLTYSFNCERSSVSFPRQQILALINPNKSEAFGFQTRSINSLQNRG